MFTKFKINLFQKVFIKRIWNIFYSLNYDEHTEPGWTLEQHTNSEITLEKIRQGGWDVVILQVYKHILGLIYKSTICIYSLFSGTKPVYIIWRKRYLQYKLFFCQTVVTWNSSSKPWHQSPMVFDLGSS